MNDLLLLSIIAFSTSAMTGVLGLGGGILLLALMGNLLPPLVVIPVHALVQLFSNASRATFLRQDIVLSVLPAFVGGIALGGALAYPLLDRIDPAMLPLPLACFILLVTWLPVKTLGSRLPNPVVLLGALQGFLSPFLGATGIIVPPFLLRHGLSSHQVVATHALLMALVHIAKIVIFGFIGFAFVQYAPLLAAMVAATVTGSWAGTRVRRRFADERLQWLLKVMVTLLALRMLWRALF